MDLFYALLILAFIAALGFWASPITYRHFYYRAEARDIAYHRDHPGCSYEEAHRHRDRVNRLFLK